MVANARQPPQPITALVEPGAPLWAQRMLLKFQTFFQPIWPRSPVRIWACPKADLPPATDWPSTLVYVPDQDCAALSDGADWRKITLGAPV